MSFGKKKKETYYDTQAQNAIADVKTVSPLQKKIDEKALNWLNWEDSTAPKDITTAPGINPFLDIYGAANKRAMTDRVGMGAMNLADTNSAYTDQLKTQNQMNVRDITAEGLNDALSGLKAEAYGLANQSNSADAARKGLTANLALQQQQNYYNRPKKKAWWESLFDIGLGTAGTVAGGFI